MLYVVLCCQSILRLCQNCMVNLRLQVNCPSSEVKLNLQTFGNKSEDQDDFFKGSTLASYIMLNDNLRYHEEQYKKEISFEFSLSSSFFLLSDYCYSFSSSYSTYCFNFTLNFYHLFSLAWPTHVKITKRSLVSC